MWDGGSTCFYYSYFIIQKTTRNSPSVSKKWMRKRNRRGRVEPASRSGPSWLTSASSTSSSASPWRTDGGQLCACAKRGIKPARIPTSIRFSTSNLISSLPMNYPASGLPTSSAGLIICSDPSSFGAQVPSLRSALGIAPIDLSPLLPKGILLFIWFIWFNLFLSGNWLIKLYLFDHFLSYFVDRNSTCR